MTNDKKTLADVMSRHILTATPEDSLAQAATTMTEAKVSSLLVTNGGQAIGIVTERDILHGWGRGLPADLAVRVIMSSPVMTAPSDMDWKTAYLQMASRNFRHLLVTAADGSVTGVVSETEIRRHLGADLLAKFQNLASVMHSEVYTCHPDLSVEEAVKGMDSNAASCLVVVERGRPLGVITERDAVRLFSDRGRMQSRPICEVMSTPAVTIPIYSTLPVAYELMRLKGLRHLVVTREDGRLAGTLSEHDIVMIIENQYIDELHFQNQAILAALQDSEAKLQSIFDQTDVFLGLLDPAGLIVKMNSTALRAIGIPLGELVGRPFWETPWCSHDVSQGARLREALAGACAGTTHRFELSHRRPFGGLMTVDVSTRPVYGDDGQPLYLLVEGFDVTQRKRSERALQESESRFRTLFEQSPVAYQSLDIQGRYIDVNDKLCQLLGYGRDELLEKSFAEVWVDDLKPCFPEKFSHAKQQQQVVTELQLLKKNRERITVVLSGRTERDLDGNFVRTHCILTDISGRKRAELREQARNQVLEMILQGAGLQEILEAIVKSVEAEDSSLLCSILLLDEYRKHLLHGAAPSLPDDYNAAIHGVAIGPGVGSCGTAAFTGERVIVEDIDTHPYWTPYRELAAGARLASCWSEPIRTADGNILGTFAVYHRHPACPSASQLELIASVANLAAIAIEHKRAESTKVLLQNLIEHTRDPIYMILLSDGYPLTYVNEAAVNHFGYPREKLLSMRIPDWDPFFDTACIPGMKAATTAGQRVIFESVHCLANGEEVPVEISANYLTHEGKEYGFGYFHDISERKLNERKLQESARFLSTVLDTLTAQIVILDGAGTIVYANENWRRFSGQNNCPGENLDVGASYFASPWPRQASNQPLSEPAYTGIRQVLEGKLPRFEWEYPCHSGDQRRWFQLRALPFDGMNGRSVIVCHENITEIKLMMESLRLAATTFETNEAIMITDINGKILRVNQAFTKITGYRNEEVVGENPRLLKSGRHNAAFYRELWQKLALTGNWQGEIWNRRKNGEIFPERETITAVKADNGEVTHYVAIFSDITDMKEAEEQIRNLAYYDPLTGLPNRRLFLDRLDHALKTQQRHGLFGAILFMDLDHFKILNDALGHNIGDLLLEQVAQRLKTCLREEDTPARLGGDEFVALLHGQHIDAEAAAEHAMAVAKRIRETLSAPFQLTNHVHHVSTSIGITLLPNGHANSDDLIKQADTAMYRAKREGRDSIRFYQQEMQTTADERLHLETELRYALEHDQLTLYFQPQMNAAGQLIGAEALIRWLHPEHGLISPNRFIPLSEENGLILPIGNFVIRTACRFIVELEAHGIDLPRLAVNISPRQFLQADFVEHVQRCLEETGARPQQLFLELTEGLLIQCGSDTIAKIKTLKNKGVGFSIDDFGTGYSSLVYLKNLPLDELKIAQEFVLDIEHNHNDEVIVQTIIAMAKNLKLSVIAEGVENQAQMDILNRHGCHHYQGYFFARPMPASEFIRTYARV